MSIGKEIVIFLGPPGSGKGSLSHLCVKKLGWVQLSTGNLCRQHIADETSIGKHIDFTIKSGKLIPDSLIIDMVEDWLTKQLSTASVIILDGFPRTVPQAKALDNLISKNIFSGLTLRIVRMTLPDDTIVERLTSRLICSNKQCQVVYSAEGSLAPRTPMICDECSSPLIRRADDVRETVYERLMAYHKHERDLVHYYEKTGQLVYELNAERPIEEVFEQFATMIGLEIT